ncbi:MAG: DUF2189 domain-containing protein, partial [Gammaproteobacteria bacterium]|nr:DUF2189 domain-containing protein [Gammaproteobacteria bacterium]
MQLVVTKSNTLNAFSWIKQGWRLFTLQPGPFMGMSAIIIACTLLANLNVLFGIIVVFLTPFLSAGFYHCASKAEQGEKLSVTDLFLLLGQISKYRVFIRLATFSVLFSILITFVADDIALAIQEERIPEFQDLLVFVVLLAINFMLFAFAVPAAWVAPEKPALELVGQSFQACWINAIPLTVYGLIILILIFIAMPIILVGWLILYSVSVLSFYQMFLTIYQPEQSPKETDIENTLEPDVVENDSDTQDGQTSNEQESDVQQEDV